MPVEVVNDVINRARARIFKAQRLVDRNNRKDRISSVVATALGVLANKVTAPNSKVGAMQFLDLGTVVLRDGYSMAYRDGVMDAHRGAPSDPDVVSYVESGQAAPEPAFKEWAPVAGIVGLDPALRAWNKVQAQAQRQQDFLQGLYRAILTKPILKGWMLDAVRDILSDIDFEDVNADETDSGDLASRLSLYGDSTSALYELGYMDSASAGGATNFVWHIQDDDACDMCTDRDEQTYTEDDLPCIPGDGDFGEFCDGGPRCRCWLEEVGGADAEMAG